jgi:hypothetical protein
MKTPFLIPIVILLAAGSPAQAQIYKWVDESGTTHYSDSAPAGATKKPATVADRVSVYTPDAPAPRAQPVVVASSALSERVDSLERQLQYERLARQQVDLAYAPQADYGAYAYPVAVPRRAFRGNRFRPFPGPNVVGPGVVPGTFNGPNAVTAGNFTLRTSLPASSARGGASFAAR